MVLHFPKMCNIEDNADRKKSHGCCRKKIKSSTLLHKQACLWLQRIAPYHASGFVNK